MMSYLLEAAAEMLRLSLDVQEFGIQACSLPDPFPTSPDVYFAVHEAGFVNDRASGGNSDALGMRLRFRVTISVRATEWPEDRQDTYFSDQSRNILKIAEKVGWILHQERWNVMAMANDRAPKNMNGLSEPHGLIDLGENVKRNGLWWQTSDGGDSLTGFSRSVLFGNALWQAAQEPQPDPSEILQ